MCLGHLVVGLRELPVNQISREVTLIPENKSVWCVSRRRVDCGVVRQHHERKEVIPVVVFL